MPAHHEATEPRQPGDGCLWNCDFRPRAPHETNGFYCTKYPLIVALNRIVLFYGFTPIADPDAVRLWQRALCEKLGLTGRILISKDGINATVGGELNNMKQYVKPLVSTRVFTTSTSNGRRVAPQTFRASASRCAMRSCRSRAG